MPKSPKDAIKAVLGNPAPPPKKSGKKKGKVTRMEIRRAKGGYIARHTEREGDDKYQFDPSQQAEHVLPDMDSLQDHISEHMGSGE